MCLVCVCVCVCVCVSEREIEVGRVYGQPNSFLSCSEMQ